MILISFLKNVVELLQKENVRFAVAGGMAASLYRLEERTTKDLDFLIFVEGKSEQKAQEIIGRFNLNATLVRRANLEGGPLHAIKRNSTEPMIVVGRKEKEIGLDFILPTMPWFENALNRAEHNVIDFGPVKAPTLKVEDVIIAKLYAVKNSSSRFQDLDDLKSIFEAGRVLDLNYLDDEMRRLDLKLPKQIVEFAPEKLRVMFGRKRK
mgnify:CR=1 FL=1